MLSPEQIQSWHRDGYLVLPGFKSANELKQLQTRAYERVDAFDPGERPGLGAAVFSTLAPERLADEALIASADQMHCFFEEEAFDADGRLRQDKRLSINKIGHALHDRDEVFDAFSRDPRLAQIASDIGLEDPQLWQSMLIFKQPSIGGEVRWHQDASFLITEPVGVVGFWFALEDADRSNGCLWVLPGGHRGPASALRERFVRDAPGGRQLRMEKLDATPWPSESTGAVPLEVAAGSLVMFHGLMPHASAPNRSPRSRMAYTLHVVDARSTYSPLNWLQRGAELPVRGFA
jgi:phytanoyl-CoA hydroxylase